MVNETVPGTSLSLLRLDAGLSNAPWRLTAAWGVLFGAAFALGREMVGVSWLDLGALVLLVDAVWGTWWALATAPVNPTARTSGVTWLPYARSNAPWVWVRALFPARFWSRLLFSLALAAWLARRLGPAAFWASAVALTVALTAWWLARVFPETLPWVGTVYGLGLTPLAGGYVLGTLPLPLLLVALALTVGAWSRLAGGWSRWGWSVLSLAAWGGALALSLPPPVAVLPGVLGFLALVASQRSGARGDLLWLLALAGLYAALWLV